MQKLSELLMSALNHTGQPTKQFYWLDGTHCRPVTIKTLAYQSVISCADRNFYKNLVCITYAVLEVHIIYDAYISFTSFHTFSHTSIIGYEYIYLIRALSCVYYDTTCPLPVH